MSVIRRIRADLDVADPLEHRIRSLRLLLAGSFGALGILVLLDLWTPDRPIDLVVLAMLPLVAAAGVASWRAVEAREARGRAAAEDVARILRGFSQAVSPDGIVQAILAEVGRGTGADHLVVVQRRPGTPILDATLVPTRAGGRASSAFLPAIDLVPDPSPGPLVERRGSWRRAGAGAPASDIPEGEFGAAVAVGPGLSSSDGEDEARDDPQQGRASLRGQPDPAAAAAAVAARIETRVRRAFGIGHTLAVPIVAREEILGVIVISRRRSDAWPEGAREILAVAGREAATALARVNSLRDAQALASTDALTGLPNRRYFEEYVELLGRGRRAGDAVRILMVDVDHCMA